eukprot:TRINITY_DN4907_c0_g1_i1.p1 TRINITY_DN4907_c0_g1~~TRINITY_DN4907_c0_g1_i1.p1  ORF type:complete len:594 (-),score=117.19 TRINITY_DN4907_c0_g1_i1:4-1785(-)
MYKISRYFLFITFLLLTIFTLKSQSSDASWLPRHYIKLPQTAAGANLGNSIAISPNGRNIIMGASNYLEQSGAVDIVTREKYHWIHQKLLLASQSGSLLGTSVAINNNMAVIGSPGARIVYLLRIVNDTWKITQNFTNPDFSSNWGRRISLNEDGTLVIGGDDAVVVYSCNNEICAKIVDLIRPAALTDAAFGTRILISGSIIIVGSYEANNNTGAVYLYDLSSGASSVSSYQTLQPDISGIGFGRSLALYGDTILVGAPLESKNGAVHMYKARSTATPPIFVELTSYRPPIGWNYITEFGQSVSLTKDEVVISATGTAPGTVFVFYLTNVFQPQPITALINDGNTASFGSSVASGSGMVLVGFPGDSSNGTGIYDIPYGFNFIPGVGQGFGNTVESGSVYIYGQDCKLLSSDNFLPFATCHNENEIIITENFFIFNHSVFTLPKVDKIVVRGDFFMESNSTLIVHAGTVLAVEGCINLNGNLIFVTENSNFVSTEKTVKIDFFSHSCIKGNGNFNNITIIGPQPEEYCKVIYGKMDFQNNKSQFWTVLDSSACGGGIAQETSLVLAILLLVFGLPSVVLGAFISQFYLGRYL